MPILIFPLRRILGRWFPQPLPPPGTFAGQRVLVTGGTNGLGLAAATHFASLGAQVFITSRSVSRGEEAKRKIEAASTYKGDGEQVTVLELDMNSYESCLALVAGLKKRFSGDGGIDVAVLNAGRVGPIYEKSAEGWETTLQVNALSTALLGILLNDWLKEERPNRAKAARLVFVTSRDHLYPSIKRWPEWASKTGLLNHFNDEKNWPSIYINRQPNYGNSKLLVHYAIEEISKKAIGEDGEPEVVVNTVCPGLVHTNIASNIAGYGWFWKVCVGTYMLLGGKTPDSGSRICIQAALLPKEMHGQFINQWLTRAQYNRIATPNLTSKAARYIQPIAWKEMIDELSSKIPAIQKIEKSA